ncbi:MAG: 3-dehydroquinate synthase family protein [Porphyromonas sp.]|nr:3-dehydroquinate synthase family protein [Porphyromonas sp.]
MKAEKIRLVDISELNEELEQLVKQHERTLLLMDEETLEECAPHLIKSVGDAELATVPEGEAAKDIEIAIHLWKLLLERQFGRDDLLITLGGGAISDLGGWVASNYKRGMRLCHIPTTLLGMIDASIGGKTAIDMGGVKNAVGSFYSAEQVLLCPEFLETLPERELLSGWGEVLKYALLGHLELEEILCLDPREEHFSIPSKLILQSAEAKQAVVGGDPFDSGSRKQLNLGHTFGHALESLCTIAGSTERLPHGVAVAAGLVCELYLSHLEYGYPQQLLTTVARYIRDTLPRVGLQCTMYDDLYRIALNDKKNSQSGEVNCTLLKAPATPVYNVGVGRARWDEALDFYRDFMGV